jgi:hypothetical protein
MSVTLFEGRDVVLWVLKGWYAAIVIGEVIVSFVLRLGSGADTITKARVWRRSRIQNVDKPVANQKAKNLGANLGWKL